MKRHKTTKRTKRFASSFVTEETRITYQQKEQICAVLNMDKGRWITCARIVNKAHSLGWTSPLEDDDRLAMAHPYWRILTSMVDEADAKFTKNLDRRIGKNGDFEYKLYSDGRFKKGGVWYKRTKRAEASI